MTLTLTVMLIMIITCEGNRLIISVHIVVYWRIIFTLSVDPSPKHTSLPFHSGSQVQYSLNEPTFPSQVWKVVRL